MSVHRLQGTACARTQHPDLHNLQRIASPVQIGQGPAYSQLLAMKELEYRRGTACPASSSYLVKSALPRSAPIHASVCKASVRFAVGLSSKPPPPPPFLAFSPGKLRYTTCKADVSMRMPRVPPNLAFAPSAHVLCRNLRALCVLHAKVRCEMFYA